MTDIIDLTAERNRRAEPDPKFIRKDDYGRPLYKFALSYRFDGRQWAAHVWAYSWEDAEQRVIGMRQSLTVDGQIFSEILA